MTNFLFKYEYKFLFDVLNDKNFKTNTKVLEIDQMIKTK